MKQYKLLIVASIIISVTGFLMIGGLPSGSIEYDRATVTITDNETDEELTTIDARIADTAEKRHIGLSETDTLEENEGMLFVHEQEDEYAYVMRGMNFAIDIIFIDRNGKITSIHHAEPETAETELDLTRYEGTGKYILEVRHHHTTENNINTGDKVTSNEQDLVDRSNIQTSPWLIMFS